MTQQDTWLGHPRGLLTLFMTEFFERFTYYGMRALLVLFLVAATTAGNAGFGLSREAAGAIYGLYASGVYLGSLPGGWIADRLIGQRKAVLIGGAIIAVGNFILAIPATPSVFYVGLAVIVCGVGLLKPNISAIVGELYKDLPGAKRDAGFSLFYMGINLGSTIAPYIAGTIGEKWNWHGGFFCTGVFMALGTLRYHYAQATLGDAGLHPHPSGPAERERGFKIVWGAVALLVAIVGMMFVGVFSVDVGTLARFAGYAMSGLGVAYFSWVLLLGGLDGQERMRVGVIFIFFLCAALFWAGFEQAATTFNLFAQDYTDRSLLGGLFPDHQHPATWYQSANPLFVVLFAPVFAYAWIALAKRNLDPAAPAKFGLGLVLLGAGFLVMMGAAELIVHDGGKAAPTWLLLTLLLHSFGELCLSPVGLSNVTKLAPQRFVGQMMGTWFLGAALGNLAAGLIGGHVGGGTIQAMPSQFLTMAFIGGGAGLLMLAASPLIKKMMGNVK